MSYSRRGPRCATPRCVAPRAAAAGCDRAAPPQLVALSAASPCVGGAPAQRACPWRSRRRRAGRPGTTTLAGSLRTTAGPAAHTPCGCPRRASLRRAPPRQQGRGQAPQRRDPAHAARTRVRRELPQRHDCVASRHVGGGERVGVHHACAAAAAPRFAHVELAGQGGFASSAGAAPLQGRAARARTVLPKKSMVRSDLSASAEAECSKATKPKLQGQGACDGSSAAARARAHAPSGHAGGRVHDHLEVNNGAKGREKGSHQRLGGLRAARR